MAHVSQTKLTAPMQERSRQTLGRILDAVEKLLKDRSFEDITIADIVREADSSVGSFYARFGVKAGLLPFLYERYDREVHRRADRLLEGHDFSRVALPELARRLVDSLVFSFRKRRWLVRAVALYVRANPQAVPAEMQQSRTELHEKIAAVFAHHYDKIRHPDPKRAVQLAVFFVSAVCRDKIIFDAPHARATRVSDKQLAAELTHMFLSYLGTEPDTSRPKRKDLP